jgi:hypothetical protein
MADEPTGRARGGIARRNALSPEERENIAKKAAAARWGHKATHKGSFREDFGIEVDCYVLNDEGKTAVISQRGMGETLGLGSSGTRLPRFVSGKAISRYVGPELREKLEKPIVFQARVGGPETMSQVHGYDATILIDLCKAIMQAEAEGKLAPNQVNVARQAHIIVNACAKSGIQNLVYKLAGYDATRQEVVEAFKFYVMEEAREYEKEFPDQLYREWYRLYQVPKPERNKPWKFKNLTVDQVYKPLARSNGKVLELTRVMRGQSGARYKRLHQFLSEIGVKALRTHLGQLLGIAQVSKDKTEYEKHVDNIFGDEPQLPF